jgi:hypothetical protein
LSDIRGDRAATNASHGRRDMVKWLIRRRLAAFERETGYDAGYMYEILDADPKAVMAVGRMTAISTYRRGIPPAPYYAAKITAAIAGDCGPCTQLVVGMAERAGVDPDLIRKVIAGDLAALPDDVALTMRFARAVIDRDLEADALRERIHAKWGHTGVISLAYGMAAAQFYPMMKFALGHGSACVRLHVGGADVPVLREAA